MSFSRLCCVPERNTFRELSTKEVSSKLASGDCLEESLTVSVHVSSTGKGELKTVHCEDDISLSMSFAYIKFYLYSLVSVLCSVCTSMWLCFLPGNLWIECGRGTLCLNWVWKGYTVAVKTVVVVTSQWFAKVIISDTLIDFQESFQTLDSFRFACCFSVSFSYQYCMPPPHTSHGLPLLYKTLSSCVHHVVP